jgi:hypothetical protein
MKLKSFYLPERLVDVIRQESDRLQVSEAEALRRILDEYLDYKTKDRA